MVDSFNDNNVWLAICEETQSFIYQFDCIICRYDLPTLFSHFRDIYNIMEVRTFEYSFSSRNRHELHFGRKSNCQQQRIRRTIENTENCRDYTDPVWSIFICYDFSLLHRSTLLFHSTTVKTILTE